VIRLERIKLPEGLRALLHRDPDGDLFIYVSDALDAKRQRLAVAEAIRASRRAGWRAGLAPAGIALLVGLRAWLGRTTKVFRTQPAAWVAAATAAVVGASAAGILLIPTPGRHSPPTPSYAPGPVVPHQPGRQHRAHTGNRSQMQPVGIAPSAPHGPLAAQPQPAAAPAPAPAAPSPVPAAPPPAPAPAPSPLPTPAPSPSPPGGGTGVCLVVLGIRVCLPGLPG